MRLALYGKGQEKNKHTNSPKRVGGLDVIVKLKATRQRQRPKLNVCGCRNLGSLPACCSVSGHSPCVPV